MADISFICPQCNQKITCDELWGGHALQCPSCQNSINVPQSDVPAAAPMVESTPPPPQLVQGHLAPPAPGRAPIGSSRPSQQTARTTAPVYRKLDKPKAEKKNIPLLILKIVLGGTAFCVAFYFAFQWASGKQTIFNKKADEAAKNSDGGQLGHIAELNAVLDATDTVKHGGISFGSEKPDVPQRYRNVGAGAVAESSDAKPEQALPIIAPIWTLDVTAAQIPEGRANGLISGTNFVVDFARLDMVNGAPVLSMRQGTNASPDRELIVYLRVKPGDKVAGGSWAVTKDMKGPLVPKVTKRWKPNPKYAATRKDFDTGYALKLELGEITDGEVTGKIFVALPDPEKSVVGGIFKATANLADPNSPTVLQNGLPAPQRTLRDNYRRQ